MISIDGVVPVVPVPFNEDESIDEASLRRHADVGRLSLVRMTLFTICWRADDHRRTWRRDQ